MAKKRGLRSSHDAKPWKCSCGMVNQPSKHRFFNVPAFQCSRCSRKLTLDFKFCLGEIEAEGNSLIGEVLDQANTSLCIAFAYCKAVEIMERVFNVKNGKDPNTVEPINPCELDEMFVKKFPDVLSSDCLTNDIGLHKVLHMGLLLRSEGIRKSQSNERYIAADVSTIPRDAFEQICHSIAEGTPLVATYLVGKRKGRLRYCQIYKSPPPSRFDEKKAQHRGHAVVIIGAGMKKGKRFFYILNSWGKWFCPRKNNRGKIVKAGIGKLREKDLSKNVIRLSHPNETGGDRRLEDQFEFNINMCNFVLMMGSETQCSVARLRKLREKNSEKIRAVDLDDGIFRDDEAGYPQTCCSTSQGHGASRGSSLGSRGALCLCEELQPWPPLCYQQQRLLAVPPTHTQGLLSSYGPGMQGLMNPKLMHQEVGGSKAVTVHDGKELLMADLAHPAVQLVEHAPTIPKSSSWTRM